MERAGKDPGHIKRNLNSEGRAFRPVLESFAHAFSGLRYVYESQRNMRIHVFMAAAAGGACIVLGLSRVEVLMIVLAIAGVFISEVVNTLTESMTDLLEPEYSQAAKLTKDVAAAGVLLSAVFSVAIGILAFGPALLELPQRVAIFATKRVPHFVAYCAFVLLPSVFGLFAGFPGPDRPWEKKAR